MKKIILFFLMCLSLMFFIGNITFANSSSNLSEIISKFKPESQKIINTSDHLTMEKLAKILNIEAGDELIGVKDGEYVALKHVSSDKSYEVSSIATTIVLDIMKAKYRNDVKSIKYLDIDNAIMNLYDDSKDLERIKNMKFK